MQKYRILKTLGDGTFGVVFKALTSQSQVVAIKKMKQKYKSMDDCLILRQIKSLKKLDHPNIIKLKQVILAKQELYLVFDYVQTNLYQVYIRAQQSNRTLTQTQIRLIFFKIVQGLAYLHKNGYFHRDMKPQNILCHNDIVKICDFGLARQIRSRPPYTQYVSTRWYRAPQLLLHSTAYSSSVDIFALACIIIQLYTMTPLFPGNNQIQTMNKIVQLLGTPKKSDWPQGYKLASSFSYNFPDQKKKELYDILPNASIEAIDLLESMLQYNSRKRPSASQILKHSFFESISINNNNNIQKQQNETKFSFYQKNIVEIPQNIKVQNPKDMQMRRSQIKFGGSFSSSFFLSKQKFREKQEKIQIQSPKKDCIKMTEPIKFKNQNKHYIQDEEKHIEINKKFDQIDQIINELQLKQNQKKFSLSKNSGEFSKLEFSNSAKQQLRMPLFSLGGLSSMTSTKAIKTPILKGTKLP